MTRWIQLQLGGGALGDVRLVSEVTLAEMHRPRAVVSGGLVSAIFQQPEMPYLMYGMGWFVQQYRGHVAVHHGGNIDGFSALVSFLPRDGIGVVVLTNRNGTLLPTALALSAYDRLLGLEPVDWSGRYRLLRAQLEQAQEQGEAHEATDRKPGTEPSHAIGEYAAVYSHPAYGELVIHETGGELSLAYNGLTSPLEHWHYDVFRASVEPLEGLKLAFFSNLRGDVDRLEVALEPAVEPIVFDRQAPGSMRDPEFLARFVGEYDLMGMTVEVALRGGDTLTVTVPGQPTYTLVPYRGTEFELAGQEGFGLRFVVTDGKVAEAVFIQPNGVFSAQRK
jgi:hypothetical protein